MICVQAVFQLRRVVGDLLQRPTNLLWAAAMASLLSTLCDLQFITFIPSQRVFLLSFAWVLQLCRIESQHCEWYLLTAVVLKAAIKETPCVTCVRKFPRCNRCIRWIGSGVSRDAYARLRLTRYFRGFSACVLRCSSSRRRTPLCLLYYSLSIFGLML